jgi:RND family efflux transporter MFP subunit
MMSGTQPKELAGELASLRIARDAAPPSSGRSWLKISAIVVLVLAAAAAGAWALKDRLTTKSAETSPVLMVQPGQEAPLFVATGTVTAPVTDTLAPRIAGRLVKMLVQEGDEVAPAQAVAELDPTDLKLALTQARAELVSAESKVSQTEVAVRAAKVHQERAEKLFQGGAGTESAAVDASLDVDTAKAQLQVVTADVGLSKARLATAQKNLEDSILRAPFHGVVLRVLQQPGDFIATGTNTGVVQLADLSTIELDAEVAEANLAKVIVGMPVEVRLDAVPGQGMPGHVFSIRPNVDVAKATQIAKVRMEPPTGLKVRLFPGMNGRANFLAHEPDAAALQRTPQLEVSAAAIVRQGDANSVWAVDKDGLVKLVKVTVSGTDGDRVILKDGPAAGTLVAVTPEGLQPGDRIRVPGN